MKIIHYFLDTETGGLDAYKNPLLEIYILKRINGVKTDEFYAKILPHSKDIIDPVALDKNGLRPYSWDIDAPDVYTARDAAIAMDRFFEIPRKGEGVSYVVAHNAKFDVGYIRALSKKTGVRIGMPYLQIDTVHLAAAYLVPLGLQNHRMDTIREFLGMSAEKAHTAQKDVEDMVKLYDLLTPPIHPNRWRALMTFIARISFVSQSLL